MQDVAQQRGENWRAREEIGEARSERSDARCAVDEAESIGVQRARAAFVIMREEFGAIGGDVDVSGTFGFASLAGQAQVESALDVFIFPGVAHDFTLQQFKKQARAAAGAVLLLERNHVAGTHGAGIVFAAFAQADAAHAGLGEGAVIVGKLEMGEQLQRPVVGAQTQILGGLAGIEDFVRIHFILRIPGGLEFGEGPH